MHLFCIPALPSLAPQMHLKDPQRNLSLLWDLLHFIKKIFNVSSNLIFSILYVVGVGICSTVLLLQSSCICCHDYSQYLVTPLYTVETNNKHQYEYDTYQPS